MNDRYSYRAKRTDNGEWAVGNLIDSPDGRNAISETSGDWKLHEVDPSTICQCTGLTDKNGKLIWENDIVSVIREDGFIEYAIIDYYISSMMSGFRMKPIEDWMCTSFDEVEVVGNIFDNPELLEVGE